MKLAIDGGAPVRDKMLVFGTPCLGDEEIDEVVATLRSGWIGTGPKSHRFEHEFAEYVGAPHALAVNSCTAGLHLSLVAHGVGPGDEVLVPSLTFAATANVVTHCGAKPVFVDVLDHRLTLDPARVAAAVGPRTKAVIPVHFGGLFADVEAIVAAAPGAAIVEDAAHAVGSRNNGRMVGGHGHTVSFSFYANKNLTTAEGGMVTVFDDALRSRINVLRLHGLNNDAWKRYKRTNLVHCDVVEAGFKYNMTDLQASLGIHQLAKQERFLARREEIARRYDAAVDAMPGVSRQFRPQPTDDQRHALHLYVLILDLEQLRVPRDQVVAALRAENIGAGIHYRPVHLEPFYRELMPDVAGTLPVAERIGESIFSLPITPDFTDADADDTIAAVDKVLTAYRR